jgi:hypothetical protein
MAKEARGGAEWPLNGGGWDQGVSLLLYRPRFSSMSLQVHRAFLKWKICRHHQADFT